MPGLGPEEGVGEWGSGGVGHFVTDISVSIQPMSTKKAPFCYGQFRLHQVDVQITSVILLRTFPCPSSLCLQKKRHFVTDNSVSIKSMFRKKAPCCYGQFRVHPAYVYKNSAILLRTISSLSCRCSKKKTPFCYGQFRVHPAYVYKKTPFCVGRGVGAWGSGGVGEWGSGGVGEWGE